MKLFDIQEAAPKEAADETELGKSVMISSGKASDGKGGKEGRTDGKAEGEGATLTKEVATTLAEAGGKEGSKYDKGMLTCIVILMS